MASYFTLLCLLISLPSASLSLSFDPRSLRPDEEDVLQDGDPETCTYFQANSSTAQYTHFRLRVNPNQSSVSRIALTGVNLGCGYNLYVTPISAVQSDKWTGRWINCRLLENSTLNNKETCYYQCLFPEVGEEVQIIKLPRHVNESSFQICDIYLNTIPGCEWIEGNASGVYSILLPSSAELRDVYCEMNTDGGGWTVLLRRQDGSVDFRKEWDYYKNGFGSLYGEFWAGNECMHQLTTAGQVYSLRVDLELYDGSKYFAEYSDFWVGPESDNYRLHVSGYSSNSTLADSLSFHDNTMFSTASRDNDENQQDSCVALYGSPWWYAACYRVVLTGIYGQDPDVAEHHGIIWNPTSLFPYFTKIATMMIRKAN